MVNVLRGYKFLFITTAIVSFSPTVCVNANSNNFATFCDPNAQFYKCNDGKKHTIKNKTYHLKFSQEYVSSSTPISALYVEKAGTVVDASQITVTGDSSDEIFGYGASVKEGARLNLTNSNFKNVPALHAENAVIRMIDGAITEVSHAIYALGKGTDIALVRVNIETTPKELNGVEIGLISSFGSKIRLSGSTVTFNGKGAFSSLYGGEYSFDSSVIKGKGKQETVIIGEKSVNKLPEAFDISQDGFVQLNNSSIELSDMHGFLVKNFSDEEDNKGRLLWQGLNSADEFKKTNIKIEKSKVSVQGKGTYGLYFYGLNPEDVWGNMYNGYRALSRAKKVAPGKAFVHLSETNFAVPDGIAIYSVGKHVYRAQAKVRLEKTRISGDLLLKAENNSYLLVEANSSTLTGDSRIKDTSDIYLHLKNGSQWHLTKSKYQDLQNPDATVSSLSGMELENSTIVFDHYQSAGYQTLHIGKKSSVNQLDEEEYVYGAGGNAQIKMSTFMNNDGSFDSQQTDRILIYGNVLGTTLIGMEEFQKTSEREASNEGNKSISLVQVIGTAEESSFKLNNSYTTVNGFPYQYKLRAYGPSSSSGNADPKNRLVAGEGDFWDFRLESVYIGPELDSSETASKPTSTVFPPQSEAETIPSERPTETILPEQPPSVEPPLMPSIPSLPEETEPSETFIPTDSTPTPSKPIPPEPPSVPTVPEEASTVPMPAPFVPVETSTDEVMPSKPSVPVVPSATDSDAVSPPSDAVEPKPSTSSDALKPSSNLPMPLDVQPELGIRAVVPQLPTYLLLPNALFHAGLMDMTTQNKKLETMRGVFHSSWKEDENTAFFLRAYGGSHHYASNLSAFEYGYGAELDYNAFQAGVLLNEIESLYTRTFFGALGNYGNLSLHPQNVEQSKKSAFHKWSVGAYGSLQHDTGFYMDGVLSYGLFKGDVLTLARGKVVALKGKQFSGSLTSGRTFAIGDKGVVFDPQVQIVYQYLQFHQALDVDNLDVDLGKFHQWMGRVGGRLSKTLGISEKGREVSFYSKLSYLHSFEDKQFVSFKNDFQLGSFGSSLEAGLGFDARLSSKLSLHGDVTYQHRLKKVGFSGAHFSAGLRHLF
ncbi:autotransporter outer membrane beta-barrel domain-containing protein [Bartonella tribocorum]|uniref:Autotransporter n=1 Tax=Bartonella tribocorum (strain DSM 28219 / CCUG 45778 / CIP 105476 / IBS 506) TaxID=382640 RepID=A9IWY5_BART1|nr:autotransporter outer membrane beta-barrel domain-containing protein [Bartonella tribocorum]CAK02069.1 autotransporter [Bartonella tribocorum CIP 105476]CDO49333.1 autotransporter [Bartonella tribocorum]